NRGAAGGNAAGLLYGDHRSLLLQSGPRGRAGGVRQVPRRYQRPHLCPRTARGTGPLGHAELEKTMAELLLPKKSQVKPGKSWPKPAGATNLREYRVYRYDPDSDD